MHFDRERFKEIIAINFLVLNKELYTIFIYVKCKRNLTSFNLVLCVNFRDVCFSSFSVCFEEEFENLRKSLTPMSSVKINGQKCV
jgi:hypothetical protein